MQPTIDRFERQEELVARPALNALKVSVIGVGAVGRQVAMQLAAMGAKQLQLIDFDQVEWTNVTTQGFFSTDVGQPKVIATARALREIEPGIELQLIQDRYRPKQLIGEAVFCCVDSITARAAIWRSAGSTCSFWCDGRMLGEVIRVLTVADEVGRRHYPSTLFNQSEAQVGRCTEPMNVRCSEHRSARSAWVIDRSSRRSRIRAPRSFKNLRSSRFICLTTIFP